MVSGSYLITGASGLLGSKVLEKLISKKINVQGIDKNLAKSHLRKNISKCDILDSNKLKKLLPKYENIIHLAAENSRAKYKQNRQRSHLINVKGSENILKHLNKRQNFFFFSSCQVYNEFSKKIITEKTNTNTNDYYGKSKIKTENHIKKYSKKIGFNYCILRIFYVFGEKQDKEFLIPTLINQGLKNKQIDIWDGNAFRDLQYVDDLTENFLTVLLDKNKSFNKTINLGSGQKISMKNIGLILSKQLKCGLIVRETNSKSVNCYTSMDLFRKTFKKKIKKTKIETALKKTIKYYKKI